MSHASEFYVKNLQPSSRGFPSGSSSSRFPAHTSFPSRSVPGALRRALPVSRKSVKISGKTVGLVDLLIKTALDAKEKDKARSTESLASPPHYAPDFFATREESRLSAQKAESVQPSHFSRSSSNVPIAGHMNAQESPSYLPIRPILRRPDKPIISADSISRAIEDSARLILDVGSHALTNAVGHESV
jgi:Senescence-associated protein